MAVREGHVYTAANDATVRRWASATPDQWLWEIPEEPDSVAISPDGTLLAVGFQNGNIRLYQHATGRELSFVNKAHSDAIYHLSFNPAGTLIASAGFDHTAKIWRLEKKDAKHSLEILNTLKGHKREVYRLAFSPHGKRLATAGYDGQIGLFDVKSGEGRLFPAHEGYVESVVFNQTGDRLLSAGYEDRRLRLWNLDDADQPPQEIAQAQDKLLWTSLSPDGHEVAAVGRGSNVSLYDLAKPHAPRRLVGHEQTVFRAIYSPDGHQLATVSADMTVRLSDLDSQRLLFTIRLPTEFQRPSPRWNFDFRCTETGECWIAVPLTVGRLALYRLPYANPPASINKTKSGHQNAG